MRIHIYNRWEYSYNPAAWLFVWTDIHMYCTYIHTYIHNGRKSFSFVLLLSCSAFVVVKLLPYISLAFVYKDIAKSYKQPLQLTTNILWPSFFSIYSNSFYNKMLVRMFPRIHMKKVLVLVLFQMRNELQLMFYSIALTAIQVPTFHR